MPIGLAGGISPSAPPHYLACGSTEAVPRDSAIFILFLLTGISWFPGFSLFAFCNYSAPSEAGDAVIKAGHLPWKSKRKASEAVNPCFRQVDT